MEVMVARQGCVGGADDEVGGGEVPMHQPAIVQLGDDLPQVPQQPAQLCDEVKRSTSAACPVAFAANYKAVLSVARDHDAGDWERQREACHLQQGSSHEAFASRCGLRPAPWQFWRPPRPLGTTPA